MACDECTQLRAEVAELRAALGVIDSDPTAIRFRHRFHLTRTEVRILLQIYSASCRVVSRYALAELLDMADPHGKAVHVHMHHLRVKLGQGTIFNEPGVGYGLTPVGLALCRDVLRTAVTA